jgi:unsaturated chondroitin disaccharide hydrolase
VVLTTAAALLAASPAAPATASDGERSQERLLRAARAHVLARLAATERELAPGRFPTVALPGRPWRTSDTGGWLAGFYPGRLWMAYELTGKRRWARLAARRQAPLAVRRTDTSTHDLGFLLQTSFGRGATLTGRADLRAVTRSAAASLAQRWVPAAGALRSWDDGPQGQATVIVDNLVNLQLLFAAASDGGDPRWHDLALQHALTTAGTHVRADGSTVHVVRFDERTGSVVWKGTVQGLRDDSTWARGQSWAVYGFTGAYRETRHPRLLAAARATADYAIGNRPADGVPWWDYAAPAAGDRTRDTTAAAALASGLLELARIDPVRERRRTYEREGRRVLRSLAGPRYLSRGTRVTAILRHGRHSATYADAGVTYGDHYFVEALLRSRLLPSRRPAVETDVRRTGAHRLRATTGGDGTLTAVSVRWRAGTSRATRFRIDVSADGRRWTTAHRGVSSGRVSTFETYDVRDRRVRAVRVVALDGGSPVAVRLRG